MRLKNNDVFEVDGEFYSTYDAFEKAIKELEGKP